MNHKLKTAVFKFLNLFPANSGMTLYHFLQNFSENKNIDVKIKSSEDTFITFQNICNTLNISIQGSSIIEIGSGWLPIMPYFFIYKGGAKKVVTYDLNSHYQKKAIANFNSVFENAYQTKITSSNNNPFNLPLEVVYHPSTNVVNDNLPDVNIVFSRFVLEHVTPMDMMAMHKKFKSSLAKGSYVVHFISPSDHRAYSDSLLSLQDFLQYSQDEWNAIQTKFDYHNRWRLPQYVELFKSLDYEISYLSYDHTKEENPKYELFKKITLHSDFEKYTEEELTAGNIVIVLKI